jgi:hypothetical protein
MHRLLVAALVGATALVVAASPATAAPVGSTKAAGPSSDPSARWQVVAGTFESRHGADHVLKRLQAKGITDFSVMPEATPERAEAARFEVARVFHRGTAAHRDARSLRSDGFRPIVERELRH